MKHWQNKIHQSMDQVKHWFTPVRTLGLLLISFSLLIVILPQILVALIASLFMISGATLLMLGRGATAHQEYQSWTFVRPQKVRFEDPFWEW